MLTYIEKIKDSLKKHFSNKNMDTENKIAYTIGYLKENEKVNKKDALEIIYEILIQKI